MADIVLTAKAPLEGLDIATDTCRLRAVSDLGFVSLAIPQGGDKPFAAALKKACGLALPDARVSTVSARARAVRTGPDQVMLMLPEGADTDGASVATTLDGTAYTTEQTGAWVVIELSGTGARTALERICPIDLDPEQFPVDAFARTVMEHMGALILRTAPDTYLLASASSSARSFADAVEHSMHYTAAD